MSTEPQNAPVSEKSAHHNPLNNPELRSHEVPEVLDFLKDNGMSILIGVGLAVVAFVGYSAFRNYRQTQETTASTMLFNSRAAEQFQQVVDQYPTSEVAPLAMLAVAGDHFDKGQYELAQHAFGQFLQKYPDHSLRLAAELGNLQCLEALNRSEEALDGYGKFIEANRGRFLETVAAFGKGRSLEQLGRMNEARAVYEDIMLADPKGRWAGRAESMLNFIDMQIRAAARGATAAAPAAPAPAVEPVSLVTPGIEIPVASPPSALQP